MAQETTGGQEATGGGGAASLTLAQVYGNGAGPTDGTLTLDATRGGVAIVASALTGIVPLAVTISTAATAGTEKGIAVAGTFSPASGNAAYQPVSVSYTVNQTGSASGAVTGLFLNATETAVLGAHALLDLQVGGTSRFKVNAVTTVLSASGAVLDAISAQGHTVTITGTTAIATAGGFNYVTVAPPTLNAASAAVVITNASTMAVTGPPVLGGAGPATATNLTAIAIRGTWTNTLNTGHGLRVVPTFAPTSGTGVFDAVTVDYTVNQTGGANGTVTGVFVRATETAVVGTHNLLDLQVGTASNNSRFSVANSGAVLVDCTATAAAVPMTVKNGKAHSGYVAQVTGTAPTGFIASDSGGTRQGAFGYAVSTNDWATSSVAGDAVLTGPTSGTNKLLLKTAASGGVKIYSPSADGGTAGTNFNCTDTNLVLQANNLSIQLDRNNGLILFGASGFTVIQNGVYGSTSASGNLSLNSTTNATKGKINVNDPLALAAGSSSNNAIQFSGSATTGISQNGADTVAIFVAGTERMRFRSTNIGVIDTLNIQASTGISFNDASNMAMGTTTGTKIGTATTQKLAFFNASPVVQPSGVTAALATRTAAGTYGATEQTMLQEAHDAARTLLAQCIRPLGLAA